MQTCSGSGNHIPEKRNLAREGQRLGNGCLLGGRVPTHRSFQRLTSAWKSGPKPIVIRLVATAASNFSRTVSHDSDFQEAHSPLGASRQGLAKLLFPSVQMKVGSRLSVSARPCSLNTWVQTLSLK